MTIAPLLLPLAASMAFALIALMRDLRVDVGGRLLPAIVTGVAAGTTHVALSRESTLGALALPAILVAGCILLRWRNVDEDFVEGTIAGVVAGAFAAAIIGDRVSPGDPAAAVMHGALAGLGTHLVLFRYRVVGAIAAVATASLLVALHEPLERLFEPHGWMGAFTAVAVIAGAAAIATALQYRRLAHEFDEERELGVIPDDIARSLTNPLRRLMMDGWHDRKARHEFVRLATALATRKSRQRRMSASAARLYQLEILKLRQLLQDVYSVELSVRESNRSAENAEQSSDRMEAKG